MMHPDGAIELTHIELLYILNALKDKIQRLESNIRQESPHDVELEQLLEER